MWHVTFSHVWTCMSVWLCEYVWMNWPNWLSEHKCTHSLGCRLLTHDLFVYEALDLEVFLFCVFVQRVSQSRERKALLPRCWGMRCVAYVETKHLAFIIMCWAVRAVKVSSDAASSKERNTPAKIQAAARWTCTCGASVSSAVCASAGRPACWSNVSDTLWPSTLGCFWKKFLMLTKAAFIWSEIQWTVIL